MTLFNLGRVMGWFSIAGFVISFLNTAFKKVNKEVMMKRERDDGLRKGYQQFLRTYLKVHPYIGIATGVFVVAHFLIQFEFYGFYWTGIIAGSLMLATVLLGVYGQWAKKRRPGLWLKIHRWLPLALLAAVVVHVVNALT